MRIACGDNTSLNNYPVSSEDWQIRNGYTKPVAIVWRAQFFDKTTRRNAMGGWMLEHLQPGQISDGWTVVAGHCQARNTLFVQLKCMALDGQEGKQCFNDDSGNPYPLRSSDAFRGDHKPLDNSSGSTQTTDNQPASNPVASAPKQVQYIVCQYDNWVYNPTIREEVLTKVFQTSKVGLDASSLSSPFYQWVKDKFDWSGGQTECKGSSSRSDTENVREQWRTRITNRSYTQDFKEVDWTPPQWTQN